MENSQKKQEQLSSFGVDNSQIPILEQLFKSLEDGFPEFERIYSQSHHTVSHFLDLAAQKQNFDSGNLKEVSTRIYDFIYKFPNFSYHLLNANPHGYYLPHHTIKTTFYTLLMAIELEYSRSRAIELGFSSLVADSGMATISPAILEKTEPINPEERKLIQEHCKSGYQYLTGVLKVKPEQALVALQHHENYDGSGYPGGLKKGEIDEMTCLFSIADTFSALTSKRPHRNAILPYDAMKMMISGLMNRFELNLLKLFLNKLSMYPIGSCVLLSNGKIARVIDANNGKMLRPSVVLLEKTQALEKQKFINLSQDMDTTIVKAIPCV